VGAAANAWTPASAASAACCHRGCWTSSGSPARTVGGHKSAEEVRSLGVRTASGRHGGRR
jgi:hypothetical protein